MTGATTRRLLPSDLTWWRRMAIVAVIFTLIAIYGSLVPLNFRALEWQHAVQQFCSIPFLQLSIDSRADWVANILLFVPLGYLWLGTVSLGRSKPATTLLAFLLVPILTCLSVAVEFTQLWFPPRTVSQNDIVAESVGAMVGVLAWLMTGERMVIWVRQYTSARRAATQVQWLLQAYLLGFVIFSVLPLDLTISVTELYHKARDGKIQIVPFADFELTLPTLIHLARDILLAIPIGSLCAISWCKKDQTLRPFANSCLAGTLFFAGIEFAQVFVYTRFAATSDILLGVCGVVLGVWLAYRSVGYTCWTESGSTIRSPLVRSAAWGTIGIVYVAGLLVAFWSPFDFLQDRELIRQRLQITLGRVPGASLHAGTEFMAVVQILARLLAYAPLGGMVAFWSRSISNSKTGRMIALAIAFAACGFLATVIELGQVLLPTRTADFSEVPICLTGFGIGMAIVRRLLGATNEQEGD